MICLKAAEAPQEEDVVDNLDSPREEECPSMKVGMKVGGDKKTEREEETG